MGSTAALLDASSVTDTYSYWLYGQVAASTGSSPTAFKFVGTAGYYVDTNTRYYVRAIPTACRPYRAL